MKVGGRRQEQALQDWNTNAPHFRHEGNESGCLKMQRQTDHCPPSDQRMAHRRRKLTSKTKQTDCQVEWRQKKRLTLNITP